MKAKTKLILTSSSILLVGFIALYFLKDIIPAYIAKTPININGLLVIFFLTLVLTYSLKFHKKHNENAKIIDLTFLGTIITLMSEIVYQLFHLMIFNISEFSIIRYINSIIKMTILGLIIAFFISYQLKTGKTGRMILMIVGVFILFGILLKFFPALFYVK